MTAWPGSLTAIPQTTSSAESPAAGATGEKRSRPAGEHHRLAADERGGGDQSAGEEGREHGRGRLATAR